VFWWTKSIKECQRFRIVVHNHEHYRVQRGSEFDVWGRSLFDRLTITEIVSRETNLNLDSLISEMRDIPNIEVDTVELSLRDAYTVWSGENSLRFLFSVIPELDPHVGTTSFEERSYEILGRYDVDLNIYEIYIHKFVS
jgi:hypothetical protein